MKKLKKIDMHCHAVPEKDITNRVGGNLVTPQELRMMYDTVNVEAGLLLPLIDQAACGDTNSMREARKMVEDFPDVFIDWFCNIDPAIGGYSADADLSYWLLQLKEKGAKGVGEITCNLEFDHPMVLNLFKHCEKCNMPVQFHVGQKGHDYGLVDDMNLTHLERVLDMFPSLVFIGHSPKFWNNIDASVNESTWGGYPTGKIEKEGRLFELFRKYPNLYADMSGGSGANAIMRDPEFIYGFLEEFSDRLFYGIDICDASNITHPMMKLSGFLDDIMVQEKISYSTYEKICRKNALKLLERNE